MNQPDHISFSPAFCRDPDLMKLARLLGVPKTQAIGHLVLLWSWAAEFAHKGDLTTFDHEEIAAAAEWNGSPEKLMQALEETHFIEDELDRGGAYGLSDPAKIS